MTSPSGDAPARRPRRSVRSVFDPNLWSGALAIMVAVGLVVVVVQVVDVSTHHGLLPWGMRPRTVHGLVGIITMPFLHADWGQLAANTAPFVIVGWLALVGGLKDFALATMMIVLGAGVLTWVAGPSQLIVGSGVLTFGWLGYLLARAVFVRRIVWIVAAAFAVFFFGGLFSNLVPGSHTTTPWQALAAGAVSGVGAAYLLHPGKKSGRRRGQLRRPRKPDGTPGPAIP